MALVGQDGAAYESPTLIEQLSTLVEASHTILARLDVPTILSTIVELAQRLFRADAYALWRAERGSGTWRVLVHANLPEGYPSTISAGQFEVPVEPVCIPDVYAHDLVQSRQDAYRRWGVRSLLVVPLRIDGENSGTITFYYRAPRAFSDVDVRVATALANLAASAIATGELYETERRLRSEAQRSHEREAFFAEASLLLSSSLEHGLVLERLARLAVPRLADWCGIDLVQPDGSIRRVAAAHVDPEKEPLIRELHHRFPPDPQGLHGLAKVLRTGASDFIEEVRPELMEAVARSPEHLELLRKLSPRSGLVVPLRTHQQTFGALALAFAESGRRYGPEDLAMAEELARRASAAMANAELMRRLEAERVRLEQLFQNAPAVMALYRGPEHIVALVNPTWERTVGKPDAVGKPFRQVFPEFESSGLFERLDAVYRTAEPYVNPEVRVPLERWGSGLLEETYWNLVWQPLTDAGGAVTDILVHAIEVTQQVLARRQVEQLGERLQLAVEASGAGIFDVNPRTRELSWSPQCKAIFGFAPDEEVTNELFAARIHPEDVERVRTEMRRTLDPAGSGTYDLEYRILRPDGSLRWVLARGRAYFEGEGSERLASRFTGTVLDVTERRRIEEERERLIAALERSNQELDQFAYVASHDLRSPLRGIANLSQWLEDDLEPVLTPETREQLTLLRTRVQRLESMVNGILSYSRAGRTRVSPESVDTGRLLAELADLLALPEDVRLEIQPGMPALFTERVPLEQVFMNLVGNAAKYVPKPGGRIVVSARLAGAFVEFSVTDNGPGIAPANHERIFRLFQTLESKENPNATGIGLAVVKKIVESRGGRVWVESEAGQGATFRFLWPA